MTPSKEQWRVNLQLICPHLPVFPDEPAIFGLQDKNKALGEGTVQLTGAIHFTFTLTVRRTPDGTVRFGGPFAHGTASEPFVYLGLAARARPTEWIRRWKIMLTSVTWDAIEAVVEHDGAYFTGTLGDLKGTRPSLAGGGWMVQTAADGAA